ncbi:MAG: excinuclease ABC subunit UvrA [Pseudonocardiaceae bacterium]
MPARLLVRGATVHNLRGVDVELPHRSFIVFTGVSGSGKSSLAFDTIFAEGQRRLVQSLSAYARQFFGQFEKPEANLIDGLTAAIAIDQQTTSRNPRSTVGTVTDLYDLLRLLYARIGQVHCPRCDRVLQRRGRVLVCLEHSERTAVPPEIKDFSFNLPFGACPTCAGLGTVMDIEPELVVPEPTRSLADGALAPWVADRYAEVHLLMAAAMADALKVPTDSPWGDLPAKARSALLNSTGTKVTVRQKTANGGVREYEATYQGVVPWLRQQHREMSSEAARTRIESFMRTVPCGSCGGARLAPGPLAVKLADRNIAQVSALALAECDRFLQSLKLPAAHRTIAGPVLEEIHERISNLIEVGLHYLALDRPAPTLSGGEAQRVRLASQLSTGLSGLTYVLDEPSVGLHPRDNDRLVASLRRLRDGGNTVIIVEHDLDIIRCADWVVDLGPGAGEQGGQVLFSGPLAGLLTEPDSLTGGYLSGKRRIAARQRRRVDPGRRIVVHGARGHNLRNITVEFPLGCFVAVSGVSGSGKSTLVNETLGRVLARRRTGANALPAAHDRVIGGEQVDKVIQVDQSPIGRTPRSNPATYTGVFDQIRTVFASTPEAKERGFKAGQFSFNVAGGRCEACDGDGTSRVEMQFLADAYVTCDVCHGRRYNAETLEVKYQGLSIADMLELSVTEVAARFTDVAAVARPLQILVDVGLGYLRLGQPATTLSGGEAQRVKLAAELQRRAVGHTLYILDEPTTGLHSEDVRWLLGILHALVDKGHTVIVIAHDVHVIKAADWVIDLGPEGGSGGGTVVVTGTPEQVAATPGSLTGHYLRRMLDAELTGTP